MSSDFVSSMALAHDVFRFLKVNNNTIIGEMFIKICQSHELLPLEEPETNAYERGSFMVRVNQLRTAVDKEFQSNGYILDCISRDPTIHKLKDLGQGLMDKMLASIVKSKGYSKKKFRKLMKTHAQGYGRRIDFNDPIAISIETSLERDFDGAIDKMKLLIMLSSRINDMEMIEDDSEEDDE